MPMLTNPRHELFAQGLAAGKTADEAYSEAGFSPNRGNATRLKANENVQARVAELLGRQTQGIILTRQWVIERLIENANRAMQAEAVLDDDGKPVGEYQYQGNVANRALELLGKELSMFIDRKEVGEPGDFKELSKDELRRSIAADLRALGFEVGSAEADGGMRKSGGLTH